MRPAQDEVLHFSEDPGIVRFTPHVARTARQDAAYVWAVDAERSPAYWFPRQCPRAMAWITPATSLSDTQRILGPGGGNRVHAVEFGWLDRIRTVELFAYRLPADEFRPIGEPEPYAHVAARTVRPLGPPEPVGNLFELHGAAGIQIRVLPTILDFWATVTRSTMGFSGIRLHDAAPGRTRVDQAT